MHYEVGLQGQRQQTDPDEEEHDRAAPADSLPLVAPDPINLDEQQQSKVEEGYSCHSQAEVLGGPRQLAYHIEGLR